MNARRLGGSALALVLAWGCGEVARDTPSMRTGGEAGRPPSIVLVSVDALRPDHLGTHGYARETSPFLDRLARRGTVFENAFSTSTWTLPAHASMLTGLTPFRHGASKDEVRIRDDVALLAERLKPLGYRTAAVVNGPYVAKEFGFDRGFDVYRERYRENRELRDYQPLVLETLRSLAGGPFFLFVHYLSVHDPYKPFPEFNLWAKRGSRFAEEARGLRSLTLELDAGRAHLDAGDLQGLIDLYDGEIRTLDHHLEELCGVLERQAPGALLIVTADHGEEFLEHGSLHHGHRLYDEVLRVPLIISGAGVKAGLRVKELSSLVDILPTVLAWTGAKAPEGLDGVSLAAALRGSPADFLKNRTLPLHTRAGDSRVHLWGLRTSGAKLIVDQLSGRKEFYDLVADPGEQKNLYPVDEARRLERQLEALSLAPSRREARRRDPEREEVLRSLGYR